MKTTKINAEVILEGELDGEYSADEIEELLHTRVVLYFPDDSPELDGRIGIREVNLVHAHREGSEQS